MLHLGSIILEIVNTEVQNNLNTILLKEYSINFLLYQFTTHF